MSQKDYIKFAAMFKAHRDALQAKASLLDVVTLQNVDQLITEAANIFASDNPNFSRQRFLTACGIK